MEKRLVANRIQTPDGTILWSRHVHDYVEYVDKNGETYILDGGRDYIRSTVNKIPPKSLAVYDDAPWEEQRMVILRGTFDKDTNRVWIPLAKLSNDHINNIIQYNKDYGHNTEVYERELEYRKEHDIFIDEQSYTQADGIQKIIKSN